MRAFSFPATFLLIHLRTFLVNGNVALDFIFITIWLGFWVMKLEQLLKAPVSCRILKGLKEMFGNHRGKVLGVIVKEQCHRNYMWTK